MSLNEIIFGVSCYSLGWVLALAFSYFIRREK
jgi:hypothetical protein